MRVTEITINKKIQERQYEPIDISMTVTVNEGEDVGTVIDNLRTYIDYKLREGQRAEQYEKFTKELEKEGLGEKRREELESWTHKYHELQEQVTSIEFD